MRIHAKRQRGALAQRLGESTPVRIPVRAQVFLPAMDDGGPRFGALVAAMHRAMLALLVAVYGFALVSGSLPQGSDAQEGLKRLHFIFGLAILGLFCLRLFVRLIDNEPHIQPPLVQWQARAAKFVQRALYLFLLAMPLAGWLILNASGKPLALYGLELPVVVSPDRELATTLKNVHYIGALLGGFLMGLNIVALVYQQHAPSQRLPRPRALPNLR